MASLWPQFGDDGVLVRTPMVLFREQADFLNAQFDGLITGKVEQKKAPMNETVDVMFYIVAPTLSYRYKLFQASYGFIDIYPVSVFVDSDIAIEFDRNVDIIIKTSNEEELKSTLTKIFNSKKCRRVLSGIRSNLVT